MSTTRDVAVFVGSLRKESFNRKTANALVAMAPAPLKLEIVEIRQLPLFLNVPALQQPEAYIGNAAKLFDESGKLTDDSTRDFLQKFLQAFAQWIERIIAK